MIRISLRALILLFGLIFFKLNLICVIAVCVGGIFHKGHEVNPRPRIVCTGHVDLKNTSVAILKVIEVYSKPMVNESLKVLNIKIVSIVSPKGLPLKQWPSCIGQLQAFFR